MSKIQIIPITSVRKFLTADGLPGLEMQPVEGPFPLCVCFPASALPLLRIALVELEALVTAGPSLQ